MTRPSTFPIPLLLAALVWLTPGCPGGEDDDATGDDDTAGDDDTGDDDDDTSDDDDDDAGDDDATGDDDVPPAGCPALPPSKGSPISIGAGDVAALVEAVNTASPGDVILLEDGNYDLDGAYLWFDVDGVTLRSASGQRDAVVLDGGYVTTEIAAVVASNITLADLTFRRAYDHPIHVQPLAGDTTGTLIYNVVVEDPGQQGIKINQNDGYTDHGTVACSRIVLTDAGRPHIRDNCYTGGIDAHRTRGWHIHDNHIEGFWCASGLSEHGIHMWRTNADTLIERNAVVDCARGIGLGMATTGEDPRVYEDIDCGTEAYLDDFRATVRNNTVFASDPDLFASGSGFDNGISIWNACDAEIVHNTVWSTQAPYSSIEWRYPTTSARIANNLVSHNIRERDAADVTLTGNMDSVPASALEGAQSGDLHLAAASPAIDAGSPLDPGLCDEDMDGQDAIPPPDVGADEHLPSG